MPGSRNLETRRRLSLCVTAGYSHATALLRGTSDSPATQAITAEAKEKLVNDRPSPGQYPDPGYDGLATTTFAGDSTYVSYETQGQGVNYAAYGPYETGAYDTTAWTSQEAHLSTIPAQSNGWNTPEADYSGYGQYQQPAFGYDTAAEQTGHWAVPGYEPLMGSETGAYDATAWNTAAPAAPVAPDVTETPLQQPEADYTYDYAYGYQPVAEEQLQQPQQEYAYEAYAYEAPAAEPDAYVETAVFEEREEAEAFEEFEELVDGDTPGVHDLPTQAMPVTPAPRSTRRTAPKGNAKGNAKSSSKAGNSRRRTPAKRSALLTVAVPSACVMGVAGVAAASVGGLTGTEKPAEDTTTMAAPDPASVKPVAANTKLDTQLAALSADAGDFADRASRTQERIDLRQRQDEEKKKKAEEEAAKEAARPKFAIPVQQHGLSASFGQAGGMWMSVHTGIDFPVGYGTPVMAATDGTVRTQWNSAYGNMAIVTAPDGTETWYCHLSSTKIRSGKVKAGDVIAYSGNSGNSTGPHLHFEVRPGGGSAIDPLAWLRSHGLDPR
ncbi:M23 family metallopeptidase [Streptomyces sp. ISL-94]|uniref:M23 family metallopeptidase n=1 Tax=Streptomyces sp. ISL-94 TaxID=2819190 RepID=UPI001BE9451D|nr:M23 family metallopeptidase [Streptomyces sp. ISL-94]MBT2480316.1 M23 family metallopeptidase [Streptomyces sp. ISL-94]